MNSFINTLSDTVLSKQLEFCDLAELEMLSQKHPYSSAIQLLYAQKLKDTGNAGYREQLQKTLLYYNNPLFIKYLLETEEQAQVLPVSTGYIAPAAGTEAATGEEVRAVTGIETIPDVSEPATEPVASEDPGALAITGTSQASKPELLPPAQWASTNDEPGPLDDVDTEAIDPEDDDATLPPLPAFKFEPIDPAKVELSFTPYHTIDYFAAQGIKLGEEQNAGDRFGTQLKSFTAWLKQMKRLPGATAKGNISVTEEKSIEQLAEQSLRGENADTEAMAQVWAQQGHAKKAIEIYKKLSLQIPAKSAYFAAKIDHLKK